MEILAAVTARLSALGYTVTETDSAVLDYNIKKAETTLKARTNQLEVPEGLFYVWADMAAGMFLTDKKASGALSEVYDFDAPAKSNGSAFWACLRSLRPSSNTCTPSSRRTLWTRQQ